jgi:3-methyladenine DNA glycosylase/8-oxoguanine DNA glycosylase
MDEKYGRANYAAVHRATLEDLAETIACGGLANNKAKAIKGVCTACVQKQIVEAKEKGEDLKEEDIKQVSLDYLHDMSDLDAMKELVSFDGVGPKTASCVLLFCL